MDWVEQFLVDLERKGVSSQTLKNKSYFVRALAGRVDFKNCSKEEVFEVLDDYRKNSKPSYYRQIVGATKRILKFLDRDDLAREIQTPRKTDPAGSVKVLSRDEIEKLIKEAPTLRDRVLITILYETGARRGEILNLKLKNVQFDEHGAIVWLSGKSGTRTRRIYGCVPDLRQLINNHPRKDDPEAPIFLTAYGQAYTKDTIYKRIKNLGRRILNKEIHPHMLRHTRATEDSRYFTDREMMLLFGWKKADQISVYSHLSMRDVENKDLEIHGLKPRDKTLQPLINAQKCSKCGEPNAAVAVYCVRCGSVLSNPQFLNLLKDPEFMEKVINHEVVQSAFQDVFQDVALKIRADERARIKKEGAS